MRRASLLGRVVGIAAPAEHVAVDRPARAAVLCALAENPELSRVFRQALSDFESLSADDRWTLYVLLEYLINVNEAAWKYYDKGIINQEEADYYAQGLCKLIGRDPDLVDAWRSNKQDRLPGFYDYVSGVCEL